MRPGIAHRPGVCQTAVATEELVGLSDRMLVMRDGAIAGALHGSEITEAAVVGLAAGSGPAPTHGGGEPCRTSA